MRKVLVLTGDGINSENELALAFSRQGASVTKLHVNVLLAEPSILRNYELLALPGGFSFGDEIRSGKILAEKMRDVLSGALAEFRARDGRIIGICNGFQVLAQLGVFDEGERSFTLAENDHRTFIDKWTKLTITENGSAWFRNLSGSLYLPVRHREGRIVGRGELRSALSYDEDVNGSKDRIAGVTDRSGNVLGLMPHPEVACFGFLHPFKDGAEENAAKVTRLFINGLA